jgi:hypothetical protein
LERTFFPSPSPSRNLTKLNPNSIATCSALALDLRTYKKTHRKGVYALPEDDKDAQMLKELPQTTARETRYEPLKERIQATTPTAPMSPFHDESDIGYHSGYGHAEQAWGPLDEKRVDV